MAHFKTIMARDLCRALKDARASISDDEQREYDPETLDEMFQYQFNVNVRGALETRKEKDFPLTAEELEKYTKDTFPNYNEVLDTKTMAQQAQSNIKGTKRILSSIKNLPALENEEPFDPNPWPDYNQVLDIENVAKRASDDIKSVKEILSAIAKAPFEEKITPVEMSMNEAMRVLDGARENMKRAMANIAKVDLLEDEEITKPSPASNKDRRQAGGPQPV